MAWAEWCPHCHTMMPHFDAAAKSKNRSIQAIKVEEQMLPAVNKVIQTHINKTAAPINVEGYPSIILVDNKGNTVTNLEPVRNTKTMSAIMDNAGPLAEEAGLNSSAEDPVIIANNLKKSIKNMIANNGSVSNIMAMNANVANNTKVNKTPSLLANIGAPNKGLVNFRNADIGEDTLLGSIASANNTTKKSTLKLKSIPNKNLGTAGIKNVVSVNKDPVAPSPLNTFGKTKSMSMSVPSAAIKREAEEITSLAAPLLPPSVDSDLEENNPSILNKLPAEQRVSGGGRGGSLYSAMARTTYALAPAAALLATASLVMKGRRSTRKLSKKSRKSHRRRR